MSDADYERVLAFGRVAPEERPSLAVIADQCNCTPPTVSTIWRANGIPPNPRPSFARRRPRGESWARNRGRYVRQGKLVPGVPELLGALGWVDCWLRVEFVNRKRRRNAGLWVATCAAVTKSGVKHVRVGMWSDLQNALLKSPRRLVRALKRRIEEQ